MHFIKTAIFSTALLFMGCNDFLDRSPLGEFTENDNPGALAEGKVFNIYTSMRNYNLTSGIPAFAIEYFRSEDQEKGSIESDGAGEAAMYDDFLYNASNGLIASYWSQNYAVIYQCNDVLDIIRTGNLTEENDLRNKGEALFHRAYCYFNLVRAFGEVPLVVEKINDASEANLPKSSVDTIYMQIDADLTEATSLLPKSWSLSYTGRITSGAAQALHARTYMMRSLWQPMYDVSTTVIASGIYDLSTPYDEIFTNEGENSRESVYEIQCTATAAMPQSDQIGSQFSEVQGVRGTGEWDFGWGWNMATELMAEAFEEGDPRKEATLLYFRRSDTIAVTPENINTPYGESPVSTAMGAFFNKKAYTSPVMRKEFTNKGFWVNIRLIRYADVVLMAAESANELGYTTEAQYYLEQVRARARGSDESVLPKVTSNDPNVLREAIRHERRVELGLEPGRFYDLVRWGIAEKVLHSAGKVNYQPRNALLPIPQSEIDRSGGVLVQNPEYE